MAPRKDVLLVDPSSTRSFLSWFLRHASADASLPQRLRRLTAFLMEGRADMKEIVTTECEVAELIISRLGLPDTLQKAVKYLFEQWDGKGMAYGLKGTQIPLAARIIQLAQVVEVAYGVGGFALVDSIVKKRRGIDLDPELVDAFRQLTGRPGFWNLLDHDSVQDEVVSMKPPWSFDSISDDQVEAFCEVVADFIDVKSKTTWGHSRAVASAADRITRHLGLEEAEVTRLRRAALVHDVGKAAVPGNILEKEKHMSPAEWERFRLHPYFSERILARVEKLEPLAAAASAHHEKLNGKGYHRQLAGNQLHLEGRILAVADTYASLTRQGPEDGQERALQMMASLVGPELDGDCYNALVASLSGGSPTLKQPPRPPLAAALTGRETQVLHALAEGMNNKQIAKALFISENTVERHLDNIYNKLGVSSRTAAVIFAVHHGILPQRVVA